MVQRESDGRNNIDADRVDGRIPVGGQSDVDAERVDGQGKMLHSIR